MFIPRDPRINAAQKGFEGSSALVWVFDYAQNALRILPYFAMESVLFGIHTVLITLVLIDIVRRRRESRRSKQWIRGLAILMYFLATIHFALIVAYAYWNAWSAIFLACAAIATPSHNIQLPDGCVYSANMVTKVAAGLPAVTIPPRVLPRLLVVNMALSDIIVVWRAWILWPRRRVIQTISCLLLSGTLVSLICGAIVDVSLAGGGLPGVILSWVTNLWSTGLISWKAWKHRQLMKHNLTFEIARTRGEKVLMLFMESGFVYTLIWTFIAISKSYLLEQTTKTDSNSGGWALAETEAAKSILEYTPFGPAHASLQAFSRFVNYMVMCGLMQFISIYPAAVVVLAERTNSYYNRTLKLESVITPRGPALDRNVTPGLDTEIISFQDIDEGSPTPEPTEPGAKGAAKATANKSLISGIRYVTVPAPLGVATMTSQADPLRSAFYAESSLQRVM